MLQIEAARPSDPRDGSSRLEEAQADSQGASTQFVIQPHHFEHAGSESKVVSSKDSSDPTHSRDYFSASKNTVPDLQKAEQVFTGHINAVDKSYDKIDESMNQYTDSVKSLSAQFANVHQVAKDMHKDVINEFKENEAQRMCDFENVERRLRGEPELPCSDTAEEAKGQEDEVQNQAASMSEHDEANESPKSEQSEAEEALKSQQNDAASMSQANHAEDSLTSEQNEAQKSLASQKNDAASVSHQNDVEDSPKSEAEEPVKSQQSEAENAAESQQGEAEDSLKSQQNEEAPVSEEKQAEDSAKSEQNEAE